MSSCLILTFAEKIKLIQDFEISKMSMTGYGKKNKMPESTLSGILKKKGLLAAEAVKGGRMKSSHTCKYIKMQNLVGFQYL